jgi:hypothetical protein
MVEGIFAAVERPQDITEDAFVWLVMEIQNENNY